MKTFFGRFFAQQFKRSAMPDGPKVGSVALSPRGDWRMPSDASAAVWARRDRTARGRNADRQLTERMKKPLIFLLAVCCSVPAVAQDWKEALRNAASNIVDKATGGKATEALMVGDWEYASPGVKLGSDDLLADVGASALTGRMEAQLETLYALAGIRAGACRFSFAADKSFTAAFGSRTMQGTYEFAGESHDSCCISPRIRTTIWERSAARPICREPTCNCFFRRHVC